MKKMLLVMAATALVGASAVQAQSETVTSVNVVGYYTVTIPSNGLALVTPVLEGFGAGTLEDIIGAQLPVGSEALLWDRVNKTYIPASRGRGGWSSTNLILRGDGVWLRPTLGSGEVTVTFMGEVPAANNMGTTTTVANISGVDAVGYGYPVDFDWTNSALSQAVPTGAELLIWNVAGQTYNPYSKGRGGWTTPAGFKIKAGEAFWIRTTNAVDWVQTVPYTL